jgi:DNA polymerase/3'-5' exonuclease PolX
MSEGKRVPRAEALDAANKIYDLLAPICERVAIAGSLRRGKPDVGDIEIVCVPMPEADLFGDECVNSLRIHSDLIHAGYRMGKFDGDHFKQFDAGPCNCDLFITTRPQFGVIFTIRTGCAEFSHRLVTPRSQGGLLMPSSLRVKDGRIWHGDTAYDTPEEINVFEIMGLKWIPPEERTR